MDSALETFLRTHAPIPARCVVGLEGGDPSDTPMADALARREGDATADLVETHEEQEGQEESGQGGEMGRPNSDPNDNWFTTLTGGLE